MNTARLQELLDKFEENDLSDAEWDELKSWYKALHHTHVDIGWMEADKVALAREMRSEFRRDFLGQTAELPQKRRLPWRTMAAAAIVVGLVMTGLYLFFQGNGKSLPELTARDSQQKRFRNDVEPGKHRATLILASGQQVVLDSIHGTIPGQNDIDVQNKRGLLSYEGTGIASAAIPRYNTLSTTKGETYSVRLSDGTMVWLNSGSALRFPVIFPGQQRTVEVSGEVYFEVAKDINRPFRVRGINDDFETEVLGTAFNVNAYGDEPALKITLLDGSVRIHKKDQSALLKPGQQAQLMASSVTVENAVDTERVMAWKRGIFDFRNANIQEIMRQAARWYDITVEYKGQPSAERYKGRVSMDTKLSELLKILELTDVRFTIDGKKITVIY